MIGIFVSSASAIVAFNMAILFLYYTISAFIEERAIEKNHGGVAVAVNGKVVPRDEWDKTQINKDDRIEIVHIVRGG